ncbi:MAG: putative zinc-binding protein [Desulfonatronovibrionaceae bacterium]
MSEDCCKTSGAVTMLLPCSGASNTGQLANRAAVELTREGLGKMFCLAGIGGRLSGFVQSAKDTQSVLVIDGCQVACGRAVLEAAGIQDFKHLVVTEYGIEKEDGFNLSDEDAEMIKEAVKNETFASQSGPAVPRISGCCCCG